MYQPLKTSSLPLFTDEHDGSNNYCGCLPRAPATSPQAESSDDVLAKELHQLSIQEREKVYNEIHGVASMPEETRECIEAGLEKLDQEIRTIRKKTAYERALFLSPRYVNNEGFRLMFLRSTYFDPKKAAQKMVSYFKHKLEVFGEETLVKRITLNDLNEDARIELAGGSFQFLPQKDRSKRPICFVGQGSFGYKTWQSKIQAVWYTLMAGLEDEDAQRHGLVNVFYNMDIGATEKLYGDLVRNIKFVSEETLPYRNASIHYCYNKPSIQPAMRMLTMFATNSTRLRFRPHFGSHMECQYTLTTFGILRKDLPVDDQGKLTNPYMNDYLARRRQLEADHERECASRVDYPSIRDVLLGRGKPYQEYSGNILLARTVDTRREEYQSGDKFEKTCMSMDIAKQMKEQGTRFLTRDNNSGGWVDVGDVASRAKVSSAFRTKTRRNENATHKEGGLSHLSFLNKASSTSSPVLVESPKVHGLPLDNLFLQQQKRQRVDRELFPRK